MDFMDVEIGMQNLRDRGIIPATEHEKRKQELLQEIRNGIRTLVKQHRIDEND